MREGLLEEGGEYAIGKIDECTYPIWKGGGIVQDNCATIADCVVGQ